MSGDVWHEESLPAPQSEANQRQLSKWLRPLVRVHANFGESAGSLSRFFTECAKLKAPPRPAKPAPQVCDQPKASTARQPLALSFNTDAML